MPGSSLEDLRAFPQDVRQQAGYQLDRIQRGLDPDDWKPMATVGKGANEIRLRNSGGSFRIIYVANFAAAVVVLHCFSKKSRKTPDNDLKLAKARLKAVAAELANE